MKQQLVKTEDGSHTLFVPELDEHYHSVHGAIQESLHVFIHAGLNTINSDKIRILEIGFGTGLNALLTWKYCVENDKTVSYHTLELYPLEEPVWSELNYPHHISEAAIPIFKKLHASPWNKETAITGTFILKKKHADLTSYPFTPENQYDLIYFDAFAPNKQEEMWSDKIFNKIVNQMAPGGVFVTYCAKGVVRRALQTAGLTMERIPGPPGKTQMLRGRKL